MIDYLQTNRKLFRKEGEELSLAELLERFGIEILEIYIGVLFDKGDRPATLESDKNCGFYSASKQGFEYLQNLIRQNPNSKILREDLENLQMEFSLRCSKLKVRIGALYGDDIPLKLFRKKFPISDLLLLKYDDIWLSQLIAINSECGEKELLTI